MFFIIGIVVVFGSVILGYLIHGGNLKILYQPSEFIIIFGSAIGSILIGYPISCIKQSLSALKYFFKGKPYSKKDCMELLLFAFNTFKLIQVKGMLAVESHIETPEESELFKSSPSVNKDHFVADFLADNLRLMTMGMNDVHQFEDLMEQELDLYKHHSEVPSDLYAKIGDSLPALGIVAAVLGVIVTMRSVMEPPDVLGAMIGAALVGTFLGVLAAYGLFSPMGSFLHKYSDYKIQFIECAKSGFVSHLNGNPPVIVIEFMRKNIDEDLRPSFEELDSYINENSMKIAG